MIAKLGKSTPLPTRGLTKKQRRMKRLAQRITQCVDDQEVDGYHLFNQELDEDELYSQQPTKRELGNHPPTVHSTSSRKTSIWNASSQPSTTYTIADWTSGNDIVVNRTYSQATNRHNRTADHLSASAHEDGGQPAGYYLDKRNSADRKVPWVPWETTNTNEKNFEKKSESKIGSPPEKKLRKKFLEKDREICVWETPANVRETPDDSLFGYAVDEVELIRGICKESFFDFVLEFWEIIIQEKPVWNWHIQYLCDELQAVAERVFEGKPKEYDLIINIPPGSTKSTICSVMFPAWVWTRMPNARSICSSYAHDLALDLSRKCRDIILSEKYQLLFPEIKLRTDQNTKAHYVNEHGGYRKSVGTGNMITGFHAHFLITDDPIDPKAALSEADLKSVNNWMMETLPTRKVDKEICPMILIMQRLHQNDPTGHRLDKKDAGRVKHICLPATDEYPILPSRLSKYYQHGMLDPKRLNRKVLKEQRGLLNEYGYAGQFGQQPVPPGGGMFKIAQFHIDMPPELKRFKKLYRYWDKAASDGTGCYTVGILMGIDYLKRVWVLDVIRGQWETHTRETLIRNTAKIDGKRITVCIEEEGGSGGKDSARMTVRNLIGYRIMVDRPKGDKTLRAEPYADQVNGGNVWLKRAEWNLDYINELKFFPFSTFKDQVDASSGAFSMLTNVRKIGAR